MCNLKINSSVLRTRNENQCDIMNVQTMKHTDCFKKGLDKYVFLLKLCVCCRLL